MSKFIPGTHVLFSEYCCHHCGELPPYFYITHDDGEKEISIEYTMLFRCFEMIRTEWGEPIPITSGYRCDKHQLDMYKRGKSITPYSVHMFGLALDLHCDNEERKDEMVKVARASILKPRIGHNYLDQHVHIDLGYLIVPRWSKKLMESKEW